MGALGQSRDKGGVQWFLEGEEGLHWAEFRYDCDEDGLGECD